MASYLLEYFRSRYSSRGARWHGPFLASLTFAACAAGCAGGNAASTTVAKATDVGASVADADASSPDASSPDTGATGLAQSPPKCRGCGYRDTTPMCPSGARWDGTQCAKDVIRPMCPSGTTWDGANDCACNTPPVPASATAPERPREPGTPRGSCPRGMASLPGGTFTMGERGDAVTVQPFCLDVTEVTVASYAACVLAGGCSAHGTWTSYSASYGTTRSSEGCNYCESRRGNHPMNCVDWNQSGDYCKAQGKRLPTEEEWEWAARGGAEGRTYPWGKTAPASVSQLCWGDGTCPVGSFPKGDAPGGIHDLAGNVWEWTFQYAQAYSIARGGGWQISWSFSLSDYEALCKAGVSAPDGGPPPVCREVVAPFQARSRMQMMPSRRAADLGFRCAW